MEEANNSKKGYYKPLLILIAIMVIASIAYMFSTEKSVNEDPVLAIVNGQKIHKSYVQKNYKILPEPARLQITFEEYLNSTIEERLLIQIAQKNNINISVEEIAKAVDNSFEIIGIEKAVFLEEISEKGVTEKDLIDAFYRKLLIQKLFQEILFQQIEVTDQELKSLYVEKKGFFYHSGEVIHASHILLETEQEALEILSLLENGSSFKELAVSRSKDPSSEQNNGDLGYFTKEQMVEPFANAAFEMEIGSYSQPVKTQFGYHIIFVYDKIINSTLPYELVKDTIHQQLLIQKREILMESFIDELYETAEVELLY